MAVILDGKALSAEIKASIAAETRRMTRAPGLAVVLVGDDPASKIYVRNKQRACEVCGIRSFGHFLPADSKTETVIALIEKLNRDDNVDGILVQLPLPAGIDRRAVIGAIAPEKDADMLHPGNLGRLAAGAGELAPCTPQGILRVLDAYHIGITGKRCTVVGRSELVGRPAAMLLLNRSGTVTVCHSRTPDLGAETRQADILIAAVGKPGLITADMVKPGAAVIDVGINRLSDGTLRGDVDFDGVKEVAGYITPVPGGIGPMTIAMLMENTLRLAEKRR